MRERLVRAGIVAALVLLATGCSASDASEGTGSPDAPSPQVPVRIAYLAPAPPGESLSEPAFLAASIALRVAALGGSLGSSLEWVELPSAGVQLDEALAGYAAAIIAPDVPPDSVEALASAARRLAVPTVSLSGGPSDSVYVLAPGRGGLARAMVEAAAKGACVVWAEGGEDLARALQRRLGASGDPLQVATDEGSAAAAATEIRERGCGAVVWSGPAAVAGRVVSALASATTASHLFVGTDELRDPDFAEAAGRAADGALVVSGARDVSTRLRLRVRRFIQDYQAEVGSPPQPFAVEGWDAANLLLQILSGEPPGDAAWEGLWGSYPLGAGARPVTFVYRYGDGRWLSQGT